MAVAAQHGAVLVGVGTACFEGDDVIQFEGLACGVNPFAAETLALAFVVLDQSGVPQVTLVFASVLLQLGHRFLSGVLGTVGVQRDNAAHKARTGG